MIPSQVQQTRNLTAASEYRSFFPLASALSYEGLEFVAAESIPDLPFDHNAIAAMAITRLRNKSTYSSLLTFRLPPEFTIPELHAVYEQVTNSTTNSAAFRKNDFGRGHHRADRRTAHRGAVPCS